MHGACLKSLPGLLTSIVVWSPMVTSQAPIDPSFDHRARAAWIAVADSPTELRDGTLPLAIARMAGLVFQAKADRLTPDLDSALALSVMSFGALRDSPWGWYALARQLQRSRGSCSPASQLGMGAWTGHCRRVYGAYASAIKLDSSFAPALADLDLVVPSPALFAEPDQELGMFASAAAWGDLPSTVRYRLDRRLSLLIATFGTEESLARMLAGGAGGALTLGELAFFEARYSAMRGRGADALGQLDRVVTIAGPGEHQDWLRQELAFLASKEEMSAWDSLDTAERREWLRRFWADRDFVDGQEAGNRFVTHVARLRTAYRDYRMWYRDAPLSVKALQSRTTECRVDATLDTLSALVLGCGFDDVPGVPRFLDDRGLTYLRHGEPTRKANYSGKWHDDLASWLYTTAGGSVVIHFGRPLDAVDEGMRARAVTGPPDQWMASCELTPRYCVLAARKSLGDPIPPERMAAVRERGAEELEQLLTTDGAPQRFRNAFRFNAGAYALGSAPGRVTLAVDAPLEELRKLVTTDSTRVALRWQVRIRGRDGVWPISSDTVQTLAMPARSREGDDGKFLTLVREFALPAGSYDLRLVLSDSAGRTGAMYSRGGFAVIGSNAPNLSDLVLMPDGGQGATRAIEGRWVRISPTFTPGNARFVGVGYLLTGFAGRNVRVTVEVREVGKGDAEPRIAVTFTERPTSDRDFRTQRLGLERLGNGPWDLSVSVQRPDGTTVTRTQRMVVRRS